MTEQRPQTGPPSPDHTGKPQPAGNDIGDYAQLFGAVLAGVVLVASAKSIPELFRTMAILLIALAICNLAIFLYRHRGRLTTRKVRIQATIKILVLAISSAAAVVVEPKIGTSPVAVSPSASASPSWACASPAGKATLVVRPNSAETDTKVVMTGDGFPPNSAVRIDLHDRRPSKSGKFYDVATVRADACGKFDHLWIIPYSLRAEGHTAVDVTASGAKDGVAESVCCVAATTLEIIASS